MQLPQRSLNLVFSLVFVASLSYAQVPKTMSYQGMLSDAAGKIVSDGSYSLTFKLYDVIAGGTALWTETQTATVSKGVFSVILGSGATLNLAFDKPYFLGVSVNGAAELVPRMQLASAAYSLNADKVKGISNVFPAEGNVGIGTTNPSGRLEVKDDVVLSGSGNEGGQITLLDGDRQGAWEIDNAGATGSEDLRIFRDKGFNNVFGAFTLKSSGNVGIGTGSPTQRLEVAGVIKSSTGGFMFPDGSVKTTAGFDPPLILSDSLTSITMLPPAIPPDAIVIGKNKGKGFGLRGEVTSSISSGGVTGVASADQGDTPGILGSSRGDQGFGVRGIATNLGTGTNYGGHFEAMSRRGIGVYGLASNGERLTVNYGGYFTAAGEAGCGVYAEGQTAARFVGSQMGLLAKGNSAAASFQGIVKILAYQSGATVMELGEGLDYAEGFDVTECTGPSPGTVLVIDSENPGHLRISKHAYDTRVAGIVSGAKGLGTAIRVGGNNFDVDVALAGRVYCNVDASEEGIVPGDLLTTSSIAGYAMKVTDHQQAQGAILGKAMQPLERGKKGQILVLVTLQ